MKNVDGNYYVVTTYIAGITASVVPADISADVFGRNYDVHDLAGRGSFIQLISAGATAGLLRNSTGEVVGVQGGVQSNFGTGYYATYTTVTPIAEFDPETYLIPMYDAAGELSAFASYIANLVSNVIDDATSFISEFGDAAENLLLGGIAFNIGIFFPWLLPLASPLINRVLDPLILDLDDDGIELTPLEGSTVHFDYGQDGFAELTGWVSADDGILVVDFNSNGAVDGAGELFGSPTQDGFAVLETYDSDGDGRITAADAVFSKLHVWQDLDQDGVTDAGEMMTLTAAGIASISLTRSDVSGTNAGHPVGFEALFTRTDGTTGSAQTINLGASPRRLLADGVVRIARFAARRPAKRRLGGAAAGPGPHQRRRNRFKEQTRLPRLSSAV